MVFIFNNLISNAVKFTKEGGTVKVILERPSEEKLVINIKDNGIGIPAHLVPHLFDKFTKACRAGTRGEKSTGLGMSIVKSLVEKQKGSIEVKSEVGKGTEIKIEFPIYKMPINEQISVVNLVARIVDQTRYRILVTDDDPMFSMLTKKVLTGAGYDVICAENGKVALTLFNKESFDLILMDQMMPEMDGIEATRLIRNQNKTIPIIALTGRRAEQDQKACLDAGCNSCLTKPVKLKNLELAVSEALRLKHAA